MTIAALVRQSSLRAANVAAFASVIVAVLVTFALTALLFTAKSHAAAAMADEAGLRASIAKAQKALRGLVGNTHPTIVQGSIASGMFQRQLDDSADARQCVVTSFEASGDAAQFVTRYAKNTTDAGWLQTPVRTEIQGNAADCFFALSELTKSRVPLEFDTLELDRVALDPGGSAKVSVGAELRALVWAGAK